MIDIDYRLSATDLVPDMRQMWEASAGKIVSIERSYAAERGTPVFTVSGRYTAQGWTEWTQGFQFGCPSCNSTRRTIEVSGPGTDQRAAYDAARHAPRRARPWLQPCQHLRHPAAFDLRGAAPRDQHELLEFYELAIPAERGGSGRRWSKHRWGRLSLLVLRPALAFLRHDSVAAVPRPGRPVGAWQRRERRADLLARPVVPACPHDCSIQRLLRGRSRPVRCLRPRCTRSLFNCKDGRYRCPSTQQGYSPFTTWTRGLAWIMPGYASSWNICSSQRPGFGAVGRAGQAGDDDSEAARAAATTTWKTRRPWRSVLGYGSTGPDASARLSAAGRSTNDYEPVDSSAAAIAAQGLLRLGCFLHTRRGGDGQRYDQPA